VKASDCSLEVREDNVLAIHVMNQSKTSSDFVIDAKLKVKR
jgi:hypothetical protein